MNAKRYPHVGISLHSATGHRLAAVALLLGAFLTVQYGGRHAAAMHPPAFTPGGTIVFARHNRWYTVAPDGTHLHVVLRSTYTCPDFGCAAFSPDGNRIMVSALAPDHKRAATGIVRVDGSGFHVLPLRNSTLNLAPGIWTPDGARLLLAGWDDHNKARAGMYLVDLAGGRIVQRLTWSPDGNHEFPVEFSPDGYRLLYFRERPYPGQYGIGELLVATATGTGTVQLNPAGTRVDGEFGDPGSWSPDGRRIAFTAFKMPLTGDSAVFVSDADGSHRHRITPWGSWSTSARWSPDGKWILFDKQAAGSGFHNLFLIHPDGSGLTAITSTAQHSVGVCCAVWSPDGNELLTVEAGHLVTINRNGSGLRKLAIMDPQHQSDEYAWSPVGLRPPDQRLAAALLPRRSDLPKYYSPPQGFYQCRFAAGTSGPVTGSAGLNLGGPIINVSAFATVFASQDGANRFFQQVVSRLPGCELRLHHTLRWKSAVIRPFSYGRFGDASRAWRIQFGDCGERPPTQCATHLIAVRLGRAVTYYVFFYFRPHPSFARYRSAQWDKVIVDRAVARARSM